jgi:hypothetical protein
MKDDKLYLTHILERIARIQAHTSDVTNISQHGFWLLIDGAEYFMPFANFPRFGEATIAVILHVERLHGEHLRWPALDVDLELDAIRHPEKYPLIAQTDNP